MRVCKEDTTLFTRTWGIGSAFGLPPQTRREPRLPRPATGPLHVEAHLDHVAVLHTILLALEAQFARLARTVLTAAGDEILV